jgi:hypothetical protein
MLAGTGTAGDGVGQGALGTIEEPKEEGQRQVWRQNSAVGVGIVQGFLSDSQLGHVMGIKTIRRYRISFGESTRRTIARGCEAYWPSLLGFD